MTAQKPGTGFVLKQNTLWRATRMRGMHDGRYVAARKPGKTLRPSGAHLTPQRDAVGDEVPDDGLLRQRVVLLRPAGEPIHWIM